MAKKRSRSSSVPKKNPAGTEKESTEELPPAVRQSEEEPEVKQSKWINKQRVLIFGCRGLASRDRHLMGDMKSLMPNSKSDSKLHRKKEGSLFVVNEIAEMKNCNKCVLFESRRKRDLYLWMANVARGPSAKFQVQNVHTMAELKMTGNCLRGSRPLLSFDKSFDAICENPKSHFVLLRELFTQIFSVPNRHPKSQPFFDRVYSFSVTEDGKIWFRHYQIVAEDGSLTEIGPRFVLNPIKIFDSSFSGATLWENPNYVSPAAHRSALKKLKAGKYVARVQAKAAYEANRPTEPTYKVDPTDSVFDTAMYEQEENVEIIKKNGIKSNKVHKKKAKKLQLKKDKTDKTPDNDLCDAQVTVADLG